MGPINLLIFLLKYSWLTILVRLTILVSGTQCSDFYSLCTKQSWGFSGGSVVKNLPDNAGDQETGFPSLGR